LSKYIYKSHNVSVLIYHFVGPAKYRKVIISKEVTDRDHVHFLIQSVMVLDPIGMHIKR